MWEKFSLLLIPIEECLNGKACLNIIPDKLCPFVATVNQHWDGRFQHVNTQYHRDVFIPTMHITSIVCIIIFRSMSHKKPQITMVLVLFLFQVHKNVIQEGKWWASYQLLDTVMNYYNCIYNINICNTKSLILSWYSYHIAILLIHDCDWTDYRTWHWDCIASFGL